MEKTNLRTLYSYSVFKRMPLVRYGPSVLLKSKLKILGPHFGPKKKQIKRRVNEVVDIGVDCPLREISNFVSYFFYFILYLLFSKIFSFKILMCAENFTKLPSPFYTHVKRFCYCS